MNDKLQEIIGSAKNRVIIIGTNALSPDLEQSAPYLRNLLGGDPSLEVHIFHESDNENFNQAVLMSAASSYERERPPTFAELTVHLDRVRGTVSSPGLTLEIQEKIPDELQVKSTLSRITVQQLHLRAPGDIIAVDDKIWFSPISEQRRDIDDYAEVEAGSDLHATLTSYLQFIMTRDEGGVGVFLSEPNEEMIWVYDRQGVARGIFPRRAFYTTEFARYSVWGLVFDRSGRMLLQQRSHNTKDNRGMWDKSVGGHVDLEDATTSLTVQRELIEEMYLPKAEFTKHVRADIGDIIDFGEWNTKKRPERAVRESLRAIGAEDWAMFRASDTTGTPLTVNRISERLWHDTPTSEPRTRRTVFISDVYFFLTPTASSLRFDEDVLTELAQSDEGAASEYRFVDIGDLDREIAIAERDGSHKSTYTDDLLYLMLEQRDLLYSIAAFAQTLA